jgi:hypothetical protein
MLIGMIDKTTTRAREGDYAQLNIKRKRWHRAIRQAGAFLILAIIPDFTSGQKSLRWFRQIGALSFLIISFTLFVSTVMARQSTGVQLNHIAGAG